MSLPQGEGDAKLTTNFDLPRELLATTVSDAPSASISFNTSTEADTTAPDLLNLDVEVLDGGLLRVTWYTSEEATESIEVGGQTFSGDGIALRKNHDMTIVPYPSLPALETHTLTVTIYDASGNMNTSSVDFVIDEEDAAPPIPDPEEPGPPNDETHPSNRIVHLLGQPLVQIYLMIIIIVVLAAFIRTRKHELDYSMPIEDDLFDD